MALTIREINTDGYERVVSFSNDEFQAFIAVHNTKLGPALGGCRIKNYESYDAALSDVLRLAKGMTYKSSLAGLNLGGGKCVVMAPRVTRDVLLNVGEAVDYFNGTYITAEDVGTTLPDMAIINETTQHVVHLDGSSNTALGVLVSMITAIRYRHSLDCDNGNLPRHAWENPSIGSVWVQGLGKVGADLASRICALANSQGTTAPLYVSDLHADLVDKAVHALGAKAFVESDQASIAVYAPCAMGQVISDDNIDAMDYSVICGSANNQLSDDKIAVQLKDKGILYCPDYLVNAGGVITAAGEVEGWDDDEVLRRCTNIGNVLFQVIETADNEGITTLDAANRIAEARL